jgi:hypothetical protein
MCKFADIEEKRPVLDEISGFEWIGSLANSIRGVFCPVAEENLFVCIRS